MNLAPGQKAGTIHDSNNKMRHWIPKTCSFIYNSVKNFSWKTIKYSQLNNVEGFPGAGVMCLIASPVHRRSA